MYTYLIMRDMSIDNEFILHVILGGNLFLTYKQSTPIGSKAFTDRQTDKIIIEQMPNG